MQKKYKYSIVMGRFQPFHLQHLRLVKHALSISDRCIIAVGSSFKARTIKNPWTYKERIDIIKSYFTKTERIQFVPVRDYAYNDQLWAKCLETQINAVVKGDKTCICGVYKDESSSYLDWFEWSPEHLKLKSVLSAISIRKAMFEDSLAKDNTVINNDTFKYIEIFKNSSMYTSLKEEYNFMLNHKKAWSSSPYPPTFQTADALVIASEHILLIERGRSPGKGLYALPGGYVNQGETLKRGSIRELKEETGLDISNDHLCCSMAKEKTFDSPERSLRGRIITQVFLYNLNVCDLPLLHPGDDANKAIWMQIPDVLKQEETFFEDHYHIINYFLTQRR